MIRCTIVVALFLPAVLVAACGEEDADASAIKGVPIQLDAGGQGSGGQGGTTATGQGGAGGTTATGGGCERFEYVVTPGDCTKTGCGAVSCKCDPWPRSVTACTKDGCVTAANCAQVCAAASLGDAVTCTKTYTVR